MPPLHKLLYPPSPCTWGHMQTAPHFSWDSSIGKFVGPVQKSNLEKAISEAARLEEEKLVRYFLIYIILNAFPWQHTPTQAKLTRSKLLMKTMAQQRLKVSGHF